MKILLVDDDDSNLKLLRLVLDGEQNNLVFATNGQEALLKARETRPDLVISDILMPVMDGYALCRIWVKDPDLRKIPFIFYTATYKSEEDEAFGLSLGAAAFLRKPMDPEPFLNQVGQVVQQAREGMLPHPEPVTMDERSFLKLYNERLVHKLSQRTQKMAHHLAELKQTEARLRLKSAALEAAANGILITDRQGIIQWANPAFSAITGYDLPELLGTNPRLLKSGVHPAAFYEQIWNTILKGGVWNGEITNRHKDGSLRTAQASITPVADEHGVTTHFIGIMQDITEHKRVESELRQSQKMDAVGRLAGGVAHDFNNMLNIIFMNTELALMGEDLPEGYRKRLLEIQVAAQRSADLTRQLLAFSRKQSAQPKQINLNEVVEENQKLLRRLIGEDIDLRFTPLPDLWTIFMDPSQLSQVLTNLTINARDALPGAGTISIEAENVVVTADSVLIHGGLAPGEFVRLSVSDTGCGMDDGTLEHIFEPFFTTKGAGKGTGLGLSMVYGIVKQNHGTITAYSHLGVGTTMKLYLPRCLDASAEEEARIEDPAPVGTETILVAEDEEPMLDVMRTALEDQGYTVLAAPNPLDVYLLAQQHEGPIHLLLTDVVMPGMNGKELQERISRTRPGIKVLYMSGYTSDIIAKRGLLEEGTHFLQKPFRILDMARKVREVLDG